MLTKKINTDPISHKIILLLILTIILLPGCTARSQTEHAINGEQGDLFQIGPDPEHKDRTLMRVRDVKLAVFDGVPGPSPDSMHLLNHTKINPGETVLDIGTGTGVQSIFAARKARYIVATDISAKAGENAQFNIKAQGLENKIDVRVGDLFAPLAADETFDVVLLGIKYPTSEADKALWNVHKRFFAGVKNHLKPNGRIYYQFGFLRNLEPVKKILEANGLHITDKHLDTSSIMHNAKFLTLEIRALPKDATQQ